MNTLKEQVIEKLKQECSYQASIRPYMNQVVVKISDDDFDRKLLTVEQEIQEIVDRNFSQRDENLSVVIYCDNEDRGEKGFKIWKTA